MYCIQTLHAVIFHEISSANLDDVVWSAKFVFNFISGHSNWEDTNVLD